MSDSDDERRNRELRILRTELGLSLPPNVHLPVPYQRSELTPITLDVGRDEVTVWVPPAGKHALKQRFKELARHEKRRAANAGNAADTARLLGGGIGGALATSGVIALATATGPLGFAAVIATGVGSLIAAGGIVAGHWMSKKKFEHEERIERYTELAEDLE